MALSPSKAAAGASNPAAARRAAVRPVAGGHAHHVGQRHAAGRLVEAKAAVHGEAQGVAGLRVIEAHEQ